MNKEFFSYFLVIIALFVGALYYNNTLQTPIISSLNYIKTSYHNITTSIDNTIQKHIFQAEKIEELKHKLHKFENNHLVMQELASEINDLYSENNSSFKTDPKVVLVRVISYQKFGNFNRLWLDVPEYNSSKIYGLAYQELVAGIVISHNDKPLALMSRDIKSTYSVQIGNLNAPGIAHGNNEENIVVKFIPAWFDIKIGDEVSTSGLDNIFIKGLKVGKVLSITSSQGYQNAIIELYYKAEEPNYFHMIRSIK